MSPPEVLVIGGGISGLAAAFELHQRGVPFQLVEQAPRLGGVIHTEQVDGFTIDAGPDSLLVQKPAAIDLCRELGLGERLVPTLPPRTAFVLRRGVLHPLPEASVLGVPTRLWPFVTSRLLTPTGKLQMALDLTRPRRSDDGDESVASFFRRRFGNDAVECVAEPLLAGIHAGDVERLSMHALFPRLVDAERRYGSVIRAMRALRGDRSPTGPFRSLPGGIDELLAALLARLDREALRCRAEVRRIHHGPPYRVLLASGEELTATQLILAVPAYAAATLLAPLDDDLGQLCQAIPYNSTATVVLSYPRTAIAHPLRGTGFVVPRSEAQVEVMAGSWVSSKWPNRAPPGQALLRGFVGGARNPSALDLSDDELADRVHRDFAKLLGISGRPELVRVYRWPRRSPQHEVGHLDRVAAIDARLKDLPGVQVTGAGFRGVGIPDCVADGRAAGERAARFRRGAGG